MAGEKRSQEREDVQREETIVLVDIEGTTTSISFVKDTLFPYIRNNLKDYIEKKWDDAEFKDDLEKLKEQATKDQNDKVEGLVSMTGETPEASKESLMKNVLWQMDNDRKTGALKQLQGHMWREAYNSGAVKGHIYEDVPQALEEWVKNGRKVYVYSSGSVEAQKLLFGKSEHGDLLKHFSGYFDTEVGPKQESASYKKILSEISSEGSKVLFLTDVAKEAKAAVEAGMKAAIVVREGNAEITPEENVYLTIKSFLDLSFVNSAKRQKVEKVEEAEAPKEEPKKVEDPPETASEPMETDADVEMKDISEPKVEKEPDVKKTAAPATAAAPATTTPAAAKEDAAEAAKPAKEAPVAETSKEAMECETTKVEPEKPKHVDKKPEEKPAPKAEEPAATPASTSDSTEKKPETVTKSEIVAVVDDKVDQSKSEPITKVTENKTEIEKTVEAPSADKMETEVKKTDAAEEKPIEATKVPEEATTKVDDKVKEVEEVKEHPISKPEEKKEVEEKPVVVEEVKQNGDTKSETVESIANGSTEVNGDGKEDTSVPQETKEADKAEKAVEKTEKPAVVEKPVEKTEKTEKVEKIEKTEKTEKSEKTEKTEKTVETTKTSEAAAEPEPAKSEATTKEEEKSVEETVEKKVNGSATTADNDVTTDKTQHRNGVNDEAKQNGDDDSTTDKESIKVKKIVESIAEGAGEPEVVSPVAVVAATS